jgi:uncharacterized protein (DUF983 family)
MYDPFPTRTTESPLQLPSLRAVVRVMGRAIRLRCPHCGIGRVLGKRGRVNERCAGCNFRFERSDDNYFFGAMFIAYALGPGLVILAFLAVVLVTWPDVPWDAISYVAPVLMLVLVVALYPVARVFWVAFDVLFRPVTPDELQ